MIKLITLILLCFSLNANAQFGTIWWNLLNTTQPQNPCPVPPCDSVNLVFTPLSQNTEYDSSRYGGPSRWNLESGSQIVPNLVETAFYFRLTWLDCEESLSQGNYSKLWTGRMRARVTQALNNGQLFAFGIMQFYPEVCSAGGFNTGVFYGGFCSSYPEYVHNAMQGNGTAAYNDFNDGTSWIPAYNNPTWQARWAALHIAIMNWMDTAIVTPTSGPRSGQAINVKNALAYVDIRGCGSYGEWHNCCIGNGYDVVCNWPGVVMTNDDCWGGTISTYGTYPTPQTMKNIIDAQVDAYDNYPCVIIINAMDGWRFGNTKISPEVAAYILTKTNNHGLIGFRRDQWGDNADYYHSILENNTQTFGGVGPFNDSIITRYKWNYFTGEMPGYSNCQASPLCLNGVQWGYLPGQARTLHPTWAGNGNWGGPAPTASNSLDSVRAFYRLNGPRIMPTGGTMTTTLQSGSSFNITLNWENRGNAVIHRAWTTQIIIKNSGGTTIFTGTTTFQVKGFQLTNGTAQSVRSTLTLGSVTPGTGFNVYVRLLDPLGYAQPFYLGLQTPRQSDGSYLVRPNVTISAGP
jgi:hypothetical protein